MNIPLKFEFYEYFYLYLCKQSNLILIKFMESMIYYTKKHIKLS